MLKLPFFVLMVFSFICCTGPKKVQEKSQQQIIAFDLLKASEELLYAAKIDSPSLKNLIWKFEHADIENFYHQLSNDNKKKAFWINIYNAFILNEIKTNPSSYNHKHSFFSDKKILLAGFIFSFDDIEHGILRKSKFKYSMGFFQNPFASAVEKKLRVVVLDPRIHFALNCGAKSCPPIAYYQWKEIEAQLEMSTANYLAGEVRFDAKKETLYLPKIMSWYRFDFISITKFPRFIKKYKVIPQDAYVYHVRFNDYNWEPNNTP